MAAPTIQNQDPAPGTPDFNDLLPISLEVVDVDGNLDADTVLISVGGLFAWFNDAERGGFSVTKTAVTNGFKYDIDGSGVVGGVPTGVVDVEVHAEDDLSNVLDDAYQITLWRGAYYDEHDDQVLDSRITVLSGNGRAEETADPELEVGTSSSSDNLDWYTFGRSGKLPIFPLPDLTGVTEIIVETVENTYIGSGNEHEMWGLYQDDQNHIWVYSDAEVTGVSSITVFGNSWVAGTGAGAPAGFPRRKRIRWDLTTDTFYFGYWDGAVWQEFDSVVNGSFSPTHMFWYHKKWSTQTVESGYTESQVKYLKSASASAAPEDQEFEGLNIPADSVSFPSMTGPVQHMSQLPVGIFEQESVGLEERVTARKQDEIDVFYSNVEGGAFPPKGSFFDEVDPKLCTKPQFNPFDPTTDSEGHRHFVSDRIYRGFVYDTAGEAWANPTLNGFTGFAKDGTSYTGGVQDGGPVYAAWASESASEDRSSRTEFPDKALLVFSETELIIFDLDNFYTTGDLDVWMRFKVGGSGYSFLGRSNEQMLDVKMLNGMLYISTLDNGTDRGRIQSFDFKRNDLSAANLVGPDDHWRIVSGKDITNRSDTTFWSTSGAPDQRIRSEFPYKIAPVLDPTDATKQVLVIAGEDAFDILFYEDGIPVRDTQGNPGGVVNLGDIRSLAFDPDGNLWLSEEGKIWCSMQGYLEGVLPNPFGTHADPKVKEFYPKVEIPESVNSLAVGALHVYAATDSGIWMVERNTMKYHLAYTVAGGGGSGRRNIGTNGEVIPGDKAEVERLQILNATKTDLLMIATKPGGGTVSVIRTLDDTISLSKVFDDLEEDGAYANIVHPVG